MSPSAVETDLTVGKVKKKTRWDIQPSKTKSSSGGTSTEKVSLSKCLCTYCFVIKLDCPPPYLFA